MGALTLCLGSSYQVLHLVNQSCSKLPVARSFLSQNPLPSQGFVFSHSYTLIPKYSQKKGRSAHQCSSSAVWPYESWDETTDDDGEETKGYPSWPRIVISELDGGFEVLAMGFGVAVSVALAVSRSIPPSGLPVAALTLAVLVATITTLRFQIGRLWRKIKEIVDVATNHRFRSLAYQFGLNKVASNHVERITGVAHKVFDINPCVELCKVEFLRFLHFRSAPMTILRLQKILKVFENFVTSVHFMSKL